MTEQRRPTRLAQSLRNNATPAERNLWHHLNKRQLYGHKFSRQMPIGPFICDFLCREAKLVIEVDGGQHCESRRDLSRTAFLEGQGFRVIRFWNNEIFGNIEGVIETIALALTECPPPAPSRAREGKSREAAKGWP